MAGLQPGVVPAAPPGVVTLGSSALGSKGMVGAGGGSVLSSSSNGLASSFGPAFGEAKAAAAASDAAVAPNHMALHMDTSPTQPVSQPASATAASGWPGKPSFGGARSVFETASAHAIHATQGSTLRTDADPAAGIALGPVNLAVCGTAPGSPPASEALGFSSQSFGSADGGMGAAPAAVCSPWKPQAQWWGSSPGGGAGGTRAGLVGQQHSGGATPPGMAVPGNASASAFEDLGEEVEDEVLQAAARYKMFAVGAFGWPMYVFISRGSGEAAQGNWVPLGRGVYSMFGACNSYLYYPSSM